MDINEFRALSAEDKAATQQRIYRQVVKHIALRVGVTTAVAVAAHLLAKKLEQNENH